MYISHKYKFVFLRTPKTGSSSLSDFFIKNIDDPSAVYTDVPDSNTKGTVPFDVIRKYLPHNHYHMGISHLIHEGLLTEAQAREYNVFSVLRDPLDRAKSFYYFYRKWRDVGTPASIEQYRRWTLPIVYAKDLVPYKTYVIDILRDTDFRKCGAAINEEGKPFIATCQGTGSGQTIEVMDKDGNPTKPISAMFNNDYNSAIQQVALSVHDNQFYGNFWLYENIDNNLQQFMTSLGIDVKYPLQRYKSGSRPKRTDEIILGEEDIINIERTFSADVEMYKRLSA